LFRIFAVTANGVTSFVEVAFRTTGNVVASNVSGPVDVEFGADVMFSNIFHVVVVFIAIGATNDAFAVSGAVVVFGETNHVVVPLRSAAVADVTFGGRCNKVSFCTVFADVDDANDTVIVFDDTGHAVGTLISTEDGVVFDAEGAVNVAFGVRTDIVVVFCTTFHSVVFSCTGPTDVAFAVGSIGVVSIVVTFKETNPAVVPFSVMRVADVAFGA